MRKKAKRHEGQQSLEHPEPANVFEHVLVFGTCASFKPLKPPRATVHPPGSKARVNILADRAERGMELWHPEDEVIKDDSMEELELLGALESL